MSVPPIHVTIDEPAGPSAAAPEGSDDPEFEPPEQLFFIHGWPDDPSLWDAQVAYFSQRGYRCLRVTMPHYGGRQDAGANGDLAAPTGFFPDCDWGALCPRLAEAVRENCDGRRVTLVIHDWGSVWGFYLQQFAPHLFKAVVAMDVGPWQLPGTLSNAPKMVAVGLAYQYWLTTAHIIGRSSTSDLGKNLGDWMTRAFARRAKQSLGDKAEITEAITSDACFPYYYIHRNFLRELLGLQPPLLQQEQEEKEEGGTGKSPACPCLFFYGAKKPIKFHDPAWERALKNREDCHVRDRAHPMLVFLARPDLQ
jgi:pimeloyl-ACP methyl ester carboxylesterase